MRYVYLLFALLTTLTSSAYAASQPLAGHWKSSDQTCLTICEFIITPMGEHMAKMELINDPYVPDALWLNNESRDMWSVNFAKKTQKRIFFIEARNQIIYNEYGGTYYRVTE